MEARASRPRFCFQGDMMRTSLLLTAALLMASCSAMQSTNANGKVVDPEVLIEQTSRMPSAAEYSQGAMPVSLRVRVTNHANVPITLKRIDLQSVGETGGFQIPSTSKPFALTIAAGAEDAVDLWVGANNVGMNVTGANEPVTIRVMTVFDSSLGSLQTVTVQQVSASR
jgi:hypothetical protein